MSKRAGLCHTSSLGEIIRGHQRCCGRDEFIRHAQQIRRSGGNMKDRKDTELTKDSLDKDDEEYLKYRKSYMDQMQEHQGKDSIVFIILLIFLLLFAVIYAKFIRG